MTRTILHVLDHALPASSGYAVRSHGLLRALREAGVDVIGVVSSAASEAADREELDGVPYIRLPLRRDDGPPQSAAAVVRRTIRLARWLRRSAADDGVALIHAHTPVTGGLAALWAARRAGVPLVYELRSCWEMAAVDRGLGRKGDLRFRAIEAAETWLLRRADAVVTISDGLVREVERRGVPRAHIVHVPNGIDARQFRPAEADPRLLDQLGLRGSLVFGFVGYFFPYEGLPDLIDAFAQLRPRQARAKLLLVGGGETEAALRLQTARLGIDDCVLLLPAVPRDEVPRYYSVCDVMVYPRRSGMTTESTTPLKPLEAMAMAKPVVVSSVGGLRELVRRDHTGIIYPAGNPQRLAETLATLANDAPLRRRLGENARRLVVQERDWSRLVRSYIELYDELTSRPSRLGGRWRA